MNKRIIICVMLGALALITSAVTQAQSTYSNVVMSLNPVAYWPLTETVAPPSAYIATNMGTAQGVNGYYEAWWTNFAGGFSLTNVSSVAHTTGLIAGDLDTAMQCGGTGQYLAIPRATNGIYCQTLNIQAPFSIEFWTRINSTNAQRDILCEGGNFVEFPSGNTNKIGQGGFEVGINKTHFYFRTYDGTTDGGTSLAGPDTTTFSNAVIHVVLTYDGTTKIIYTNGAVAASQSLSTYVADPSSPLIIGSSLELGAQTVSPFDGTVDEFAIYTNVLSAAQIAAHYTAGTNPAPATSYVNTVLADNPTIYLRLDEPAFAGTSLASLPAANNLGSLGSSANGLYQPGTTPGVTGPAYSGFASPSYAVALNGINAGVDVGGGAIPSALNPTNNQPFTVMTWFRGNPADAGPRSQMFVGHGNNSYRLGIYTNLNGSATNAASVTFNPGAGPQIFYTNMGSMATAGMDLNDGKWHQAVGVSDGTNDFLYLDGLLALTKTSVAANSGSLQDLILGGDPSFLGPQPSANAGNRGGLFYAGSIAQVAYFTNALSAAQIQQVFSAANVPPVIHQQPAPASLTVAAGTNVTFLAPTVSGSTPVSYQWYTTNGAAVSGQTNAALAFTNSTLNEGSGYYLVATNLYGAATSAVVNLTVVGPPQTTQESPPQLEVFLGSSPVLSLTAQGSQPLIYSWSLNGTTISGATNSSYTVNTNALGTTTYIGEVANTFGTNYVTNVVTVLADPTAPYPAEVLADNPMAYFRLDEPSGTTAYDYVGGNNATYTNVTLGYTSGYSPSEDPNEGTAEFGDFNSPPTNNLAGNVPNYLNFGTNTGNGEFSVEAWITQYEYEGSGDAIVALGYGGGGDQFDLDTGGSGGTLRFTVTDATGATHTAGSSYAPNNDGLWHHVVGVCDEANGHVYLYLDGALAGSATIPAGSGILSSSVPMSIGARESANHIPAYYDYQFLGQINDVAVYHYALSATQVENHYFACGAPPVITQLTPSSQSVNVSDTATFSVSAMGEQPLTYQWYDNNDNPIASGTNATLILTNVQTSQAGSYSVTVSDLYSSVSTNGLLTIGSGAPTIGVDIQPTSVTSYVGTLNTFNVTVYGSEPLYYQWYQDGASIAGATNTSYTVTTLNGTNTYWVTATNSLGGTNSGTATVVGVPATFINTSNYTSSLKITFSGYNQAEGVTNFPVLVRLSTNIPGFSYAQFTSPIGADLTFTYLTNMLVLPYEIEQWNPAGESIVWVQVPLISTTNDYITAYWGNPAQTNAAASNTNGAVWKAAFSATSDFDLVWHLNQTNFPFTDSTLQDPATNGVAGSSATGIAGAGLGFDGVTDYLDAGVLNLSNSFTLSAWINISPSVPNIQTIWASKPGSGTANGFAMNVNDYNTTDGALRFITGNGSSGTPVGSAAGAVTFGQWHLVTAAVDTTANTANLYVDGNEVVNGSILSSFSKTNDVLLGMSTDHFYLFLGAMDEARISNVLRSTNWIWASWATVDPSASFATYAPVTSTFVGPVVLNYNVSGANMVLSWSQGTLQSASQVTGPYNDLPGATSPYTNAVSGAQQFYRVRVE